LKKADYTIIADMKNEMISIEGDASNFLPKNVYFHDISAEMRNKAIKIFNNFKEKNNIDNKVEEYIKNDN